MGWTEMSSWFEMEEEDEGKCELGVGESREAVYI
jgi:hypothetical protein